jgi:hypothetical protein
MRNFSSLKTFAGLAGCGLLVVGLVCGCSGTKTPKGKISSMPPSRAEMMSYYLPTQVEILPFTKPASFDARGLPDGINAVIRPLDVVGHAVKAYGIMRFELYDYVPASGLSKGKQLMVWNQVLNTPTDQRKYWDNVTQSYQFQLLWRQPLEPNKKYVLEVFYENPAGVRLTSDYVFEFAPNTERIKEQLRTQSR